jgi:hypothetical protein
VRSRTHTGLPSRLSPVSLNPSIARGNPIAYSWFPSMKTNGGLTLEAPGQISSASSFQRLYASTISTFPHTGNCGIVAAGAESLSDIATIKGNHATACFGNRQFMLIVYVRLCVL